LKSTYAKIPQPITIRNSAYIFSIDGEITKLCQTTTHPTDRDQFPHFEDTDLSAVFCGAPVGIVNPAFLKKNVRDHLAENYPEFEFTDITEEDKAMLQEDESDVVEFIASSIKDK